MLRERTHLTTGCRGQSAARTAAQPERKALKEVLNKRAISSLPGAETAFGRPMVAKIGISASFSPGFGPFTGFPGPFGVLRTH